MRRETVPVYPNFRSRHALSDHSAAIAFPLCVAVMSPTLGLPCKRTCTARHAQKNCTDNLNCIASFEMTYPKVSGSGNSGWSSPAQIRAQPLR